jgi:hypothetical protein
MRKTTRQSLLLVVWAVVDEEMKEEEVDGEVLQREKQINDAVKHVKMARAQRQLVNEKMSTAKEDALASTIHSERTHTFIVDYGQNMSLPSFGNSQPPGVLHPTDYLQSWCGGCLSSRWRASVLSSLQGRRGRREEGRRQCGIPTDEEPSATQRPASGLQREGAECGL